MQNSDKFAKDARIILLFGIIIIIYGIIARFAYAPINIMPNEGAIACAIVSPIIEVVVLIAIILLTLNIAFGIAIAMLAHQIENGRRMRKYALWIIIISIVVVLANLIFYIYVPITLSHLSTAAGGVHTNSDYAVQYSDCNYTLTLNRSATYAAIIVFSLVSLMSIAKGYSIIKNSE